MSGWEFISEIARSIIIMSLTGSIIALLLFALKPMIKNRLPKSVQYYLWVFVLFALLVPFSTFVSIPISAPMAPVQEILSTNVKSTAERQEELAQAKYNTPYEELDELKQIDISYREIGLVNGDFNDALLRLVTMVGIIVFLIEIVQYFIFIFKLRRRRLPAKDNEVVLLGALCEGRRHPRLYRNPLAPTPMLIGIFLPVIYLPDMEYSDVQFKNILLHELTHMRRYDVVVKWLAALTVRLHWFNPIAYLARREIDRACELACDEAVIKNLDNDGKQAYGDTLIAVVADKRLPKTVLSTTMCEEKRALKERLGSIMKHKGFPVRAIAFSCVLVAAVLCGMVVLGAKTIDKVTAPVVSIYDGDGSVLLTADVNTGIIGLPTSVEVQAAYRDNTGESSIRIYCAPLDSDTEPRLLGGASRDVSNADDIKNTAVWDVAEEYPDGFDGSVWAVASGSDGVEQTSDYVRVVYDPANVHEQTEFSLTVTLYTYSGDILNPIAKKLSADETGQISLPDTVFIEIDVPSGVISYKLYCRPEEGEPLMLRTVSYKVSNTEANKTPDIRSPDGKLWDVREDFPDGFTGEIYAVASTYENLESNGETVRVIYEPKR